MYSETGNYKDPKIKFDEELIKVGYSDIKIDFNIAEPLDKTMGAVFGYDLKTDYDYEKYKKEVKPTTPVVNPEKPGLATLFKQVILTIGDILGFLFKIIKQAIDQIVNSFIMPILTPALPYSLPILIQKIIEIIKKILDMVKEAISIVTETLNWILKKVAGKLMEIKIPLPEFSIPLFGLKISIPSIDILKLLKKSPFASLPSEKILNFKTQISTLTKELNTIPINDITTKNEIQGKIKSINGEIDKQLAIKDSDVIDKFNEIQDINYQINEITDSGSQKNKDFLDNSLAVMEQCLITLKSMLFMSTLDISNLVIEIHNEIIIKKKEILDEYLKKQLQLGKGIYITNFILDKVLSELNSYGIYISDSIKNGLLLGVTPGTSTDVNSDINYIINTSATTISLLTTYKVNFISYKFTDRINIYIKENTYLNENKTQILEFKVGSKNNYLYGLNGDYHYLKNAAFNLIDELEKEELDLEEEINKYKIEDNNVCLEKIQILNDLLDKPYIKILKLSEQYRTPILSDVVREGYKKIGQTPPEEDVLVTELKIDGYRERLINQRNNIELILTQIIDLEEAISQFKERIKVAKINGTDINSDNPSDNTNDTSGTTNKTDKEKIDSLNVIKKEKENELNDLSPQAVGKSKLIQLIIKLLLFPMQLIIGLIANLFGGVVQFLTSLPLLKFDKIIKFFSSLLKLPTKSGIGDMMKEVLDLPSTAASTAVEVTTTVSSIIPEELIKPVSSIIDGASESVSTMSADFVEAAVKPYSPFPIADLPNIKVPDPIELTTYTGTYEADTSGDNYTGGDTDYDNSAGLEHSDSLNTLHPSIKDKAINDINDLKKYLTTMNKGFKIVINSTYRSPAYQKHLRELWDSGQRKGFDAKPANVSYHNFGLAMDISTRPKNDENLQTIANFLKNRQWVWGGDFTKIDKIHYQYTKLGSSDKLANKIIANDTFEDGGRIYPNIT